ISSLDVSKTGGDVLVPANYRIGAGLSGTGHIKNTGGRLILGLSSSGFQNGTAGPFTANFGGTIDTLEVDIGGGNSNILTLSQHLNVGDLLEASARVTAGGTAQFKVTGSATANSVSGVSAFYHGGPVVSLIGATDHYTTLTRSISNLDVSKTGGDVLVPA